MSDADRDFRVTVLLKEYDTLRAEILARIRSRYELLTVGLAGLGLLLARRHSNAALLIGLGGLVLGLHTYFGQTISKINDRLADLEAEVNRRLGDELLLWESRHGSNSFIKLREYRRQRALRKTG